MATCSGNSDGHCCHLAGRVCSFLEEDTVPGRRWTCGLRRDLGSWSATHQDPRYLAEVKPVLDAKGLPDCGDWPRPGEICAECGVTG